MLGGQSKLAKVILENKGDKSRRLPLQVDFLCSQEFKISDFENESLKKLGQIRKSSVFSTNMHDEKTLCSEMRRILAKEEFDLKQMKQNEVTIKAFNKSQNLKTKFKLQKKMNMQQMFTNNSSTDRNMSMHELHKPRRSHVQFQDLGKVLKESDTQSNT